MNVGCTIWSLQHITEAIQHEHDGNEGYLEIWCLNRPLPESGFQRFSTADLQRWDQGHRSKISSIADIPVSRFSSPRNGRPMM